MSSPFFPLRAERDTLDFVLTDFPFPLALTYARLHQQMDLQEPIAAAWQLRDAFECLIKFTACLALADCLHARPDAEHAGKLVALLFKPQGLSLGDWHTLLSEALTPLAPLARSSDLAASGRHLPTLYPLFFETRGRPGPTPLNRRINDYPDIDSVPQNFVAWRNRVFGHGVFKQERQWYADETHRWLLHLHAFYTAVRPVFADWRLIAVTPGGDTVHWHGTKDLPLIPAHPHEPWGDPLPMFFAPSPALPLVFPSPPKPPALRPGMRPMPAAYCLLLRPQPLRAR